VIKLSLRNPRKEERNQAKNSTLTTKYKSMGCSPPEKDRKKEERTWQKKERYTFGPKFPTPKKK